MVSKRPKDDLSDDELNIENEAPQFTPMRQFNYQPSTDFTRFPSFVGFEDLLEDLDDEDD